MEEEVNVPLCALSSGLGGTGREELVRPGREGGVAGFTGRRQDHTAVRVGVLGWFRRSVLHNQPAKSTSSTSDRLMKPWFWKGRRGAVNSLVLQGGGGDQASAQIWPAGWDENPKTERKAPPAPTNAGGHSWDREQGSSMPEATKMWDRVSGDREAALSSPKPRTPSQHC